MIDEGKRKNETTNPNDPARFVQKIPVTEDKGSRFRNPPKSIKYEMCKF